MRISQEVSHVVDAAFRKSIKAERVDTCVICTKKWSYFDHSYQLAKAPGILLKAKRKEGGSESLGTRVTPKQTCEISMECDAVPWEEPEDRKASANDWYERAASDREALAEEAEPMPANQKLS